MTHPVGSLRGFTLVELLISLVILGIIVAFAVPSLTSTVNTSHVRGATEALYSDLQWARSEAIKNNNFMTLSVYPAKNCYGFIAGNNTPCDCSVANACTKTVTNTQVTLATAGLPVNGSVNTLVFDSTGLAVVGAGGSVTLTAGKQGSVAVNAIGRIGLTLPP